MTKINQYDQELRPYFCAYFENGSLIELRRYIIANSHLPGPRGNIELAQAFAKVVADLSALESGRLWQLCAHLTAISAAQAPTNDPAELIPFCGAIGLGSLGANAHQFFEPSLQQLKRLANDPRWRMREGVCFGLQHLLAKRSNETLERLEQWIADGTLQELRAVIAAVAEPPLLKDQQFAMAALHLHRKVIERFLAAQPRKTEPCRLLRQTLGYSLSVVVSAIPEPGFELLVALSQSEDPDLTWILKENLRKQRLAKFFPQQVESLGKCLA